MRPSKPHAERAPTFSPSTPGERASALRDRGQCLEDAYEAYCARWHAAGAASEAPPHAWAWHGLLGDASWQPPRCVSRSSECARPGYDSTDASEFLDSPGVLDAKLDVLAELVPHELHVCLAESRGDLASSTRIVRMVEARHFRREF